MEKFKIYIDRLKKGDTEKIEETLPPLFLDIEEEELSFPEEVHVKAEVYLADEHLVARLNVQTAARLPCSICNEAVKIPIDVRDCYLSESVSDIAGATYDLIEEIREAILLQVPQFAECSGGNCPERDRIKKFLHQSLSEKREASQTVHFPFSDMDLNI